MVMKFVIRVDASRWIGSGHVMRCLVLADALKDSGHKVTFVSRPQQADLTELIEQRGHEVTLLPTLRNELIPKSDADYQTWLQVNWQQDCEEFLTKVSTADWVVVDHYGIPQEWESKVASRLNCKIFAIDDIARGHQCDVLLDQTALRSETTYHGLVPNHCRRLVGAKYALLGKTFADRRSQLQDQSRDQSRILVTMGGIDEPNATLKVIKALEKEKNSLTVTVLLSPRAPHYEVVRAYCRDQIGWITHMDFCSDVAELMTHHGLAIGAPGATSWERACLGLPSIVIPLAENQQTICNNLVRSGAALCVFLEDIANKLWPALLQLRQNYTYHQAQNLSLCDGLGSQRVLEHLINE